MSSERKLAVLVIAVAWIAVLLLSPRWVTYATLATLNMVALRVVGWRTWTQRRRTTVVTAIAAIGLVTVLTLPVRAPASTDRVDRLTTPVLKREARTVARNGGIVCHTIGVGAGCATRYMRRLTIELVERAFAPDGAWAARWAVCVAGRESGGNPAAVSSTDDHGAGQLNRPSHPWVNYHRIAWQTPRSPTGWASDPVYSVAVFHRLAHGGANRGPWLGGRYRC